MDIDSDLEICEMDEDGDSTRDSNDDTLSQGSGGDILIQLGLPEEIKNNLKEHCTEFECNTCTSTLVQLIIGEGVEFEGDPLINMRDLKEVEGKLPKDKMKWLSNFVIDSYLKIVKSESTNVEVFGWEEFERGVENKKLEELLKGKGNLLEKNMVLFPCNPVNSEHWFLGVVLPKEKTIVTIDSLPQDYIKPLATTQVDKMMFFLKEVDKSITIVQWSFYTNKPYEIPQQVNLFDCGVFTCIYARCLATKCKMVTQQDIPAYRLLMVRELHQKRLSPIPPLPIQKGELCLHGGK
ncbi:predicted protein [Nematostella vectensis]|uniref:Ubiquitin-like protease family profile domain-containing protein n=1 Tax=Nematostella vectensis TaxID=45351 RepID=A7T040_NEMVE|nr:predicted protein [Nematostella vectensis]|eukprot:XP_001622771.1 predicted protein [Nematostella vectensis]